MEAALAPQRVTDDFELTHDQRRRAGVALLVAIVVLVGIGLGLDRVTTQTKHFVGEFAPSAVPFPRSVRDDFRRSTPLTLGSAATGQRWSPLKGVWGADQGTARLTRPVAGQPNYALVNVGAGPGSIGFTATGVTAGVGLAFRCQDELNCWTVTANPSFGTWQLSRIVGLTVTDVGNVGTVPIADGTRVRVENQMAGFDVYVDDVLARHVDSTDLNDKGRAGLVLAADGDVTAARWSDFRSEQLNVLGPDAPVRNDFDRATGTGLGRATTGQRWAEVGGQWGVRQEDAVLVSQPGLKPAIATVDVGSGDGWVQITGSTFPTGMGMVFRYVDPSNYWWIDAVPEFGVFNVFKVVKGLVVKVTNTRTITFGNGSTLGVRLAGEEISLFVNGRPTPLVVDGQDVASIRSPDLRRARRAGMLVDSPKAEGARFAGFAAGPLTAAGGGA